jgi:cysteine-rich repeat protein|tara:strand:- start:19015 stop:19296 length:282 start_codon:yes stop_codon:yes gene_type:complete
VYSQFFGLIDEVRFYEQALTGGEIASLAAGREVADSSFPYCGDGITNGDETCDDGNLENGDGCSIQCESEQTASTGFFENLQSFMGNLLNRSK